jgi:predicted nucleic-acid-binding Zn-ribbon protein
MAISQCLKCGNRSFESVLKIPIGFPRRVMFIQCSVCGGVVGVQEVHNQNVKMKPEQIDQIQEHVQSSFKTQPAVLTDITTVLKHLYG